MATSQLELIMAQVRPMSWPDKLRLLQRVAEELKPAGVEAEARAAPNYASFFGAGRGSFATPEEADAFLRQERDTWEN